MNTETTCGGISFPDHDVFTLAAINIFIAAGYWMIIHRQERVTVYKKMDGLEIIITTDFSEETIGEDLKGTVFHAHITEDGAEVDTRFVVHYLPEALPHTFGRDWELRAFIETFLQINNNLARN